MKRMLLMGGMLLAPVALFGADITIRVGGGSCAPAPCASYPVFYPPYSYYGYAGYYPYFYAGPVPGYSYGTTSFSGVGRTIRLGEDHDAFWDRHGGFEAAAFDTTTLPPVVEVAPVDRVSPLEMGDSESRIRDLGLNVDKIAASGDNTVYILSDGRTVYAERGVILDIARR